MTKYQFKIEYVLVVLILLLGFVLRLTFNPGLGFNDEYEYVSSAYQIFVNGEHPSTIGAVRMGMMLPIGILIKVFGFKVTVFTTFMFLISMINILLVYKTCRIVFNAAISLTASLFMAVLPIEIMYSTSVLPDSINQLFFLIAILILVLYLHDLNNNSKTNVVKLLFSGLFCGLSFSVKEIGIFLLFAILTYLLLKKVKWYHYLHLLAGFISVICLEFVYSQIVYGNWLMRYTSQIDQYITPRTISAYSSIADIINRFFISYPFQLLFPIQKSGNTFGIYYLLASFLLIIKFKKYLLKMNELTLFLIWNLTFLFFINFSLIKLHPLIAMVRPNARYLMPIDGCICIILAKLTYDCFNKYKIKFYLIALLFITLSSGLYLAVSINANSPTSFNNRYYYSNELIGYILNNKLNERYDSIYCSMDIKNYLNICTEFKYSNKIKDLDQIVVDKMTERDIIVMNSVIVDGIINDPDYAKSFPDKVAAIRNTTSRISSDFKVIFKVPKPVSFISTSINYLERLMNLHYFSYFKHSKALILIKNEIK